MCFVQYVSVCARYEPVGVGCLEGGACGCGLRRGVEPVDVGCLKGGGCGLSRGWSLWMWAV